MKIRIEESPAQSPALRFFVTEEERPGRVGGFGETEEQAIADFKQAYAKQDSIVTTKEIII